MLNVVLYTFLNTSFPMQTCALLWWWGLLS